MINRIYTGIVSIMLLMFSFPVMAAEKFMSIADIHFSPFAGCEALPKPCSLITKMRHTDGDHWEAILSSNANKEFSKTYQDTNYYLLISSLHAEKKIAEENHPTFVLILGDFLAHNFRRQYKKYSGDRSSAGYTLFVNKTFEFLTNQFKKTFPNTDVYIAVGNNDAYTKNYSTVPHGAFFHDLASLASPLIHDKKNQQRFLEEFPVAGYYAVTVPGHENQKIIVLNTVLFSSHAEAKLNIVKQAGIAELDWLGQELKKASIAKQHVMIAMHIPLGVDAYGSLKLGLSMIIHFWQPIYNDKFTSVVHQYPGVVTAILPAHIHSSRYQFGCPKEIDSAPLIFTYSISPIYGNNPEFQLFEYANADFRIQENEKYINALSTPSSQEWSH